MHSHVAFLICWRIEILFVFFLPVINFKTNFADLHRYVLLKFLWWFSVFVMLMLTSIIFFLCCVNRPLSCSTSLLFGLLTLISCFLRNNEQKEWISVCIYNSALLARKSYSWKFSSSLDIFYLYEVRAIYKAVHGYILSRRNRTWSRPSPQDL